jgi:hypothetical protein
MSKAERILRVTNRAEIHQIHTNQLAEAKRQVALMRTLIHDVRNNLTVGRFLIEQMRESIRWRHSLRAACGRKKTTSN